jgi:hypothetical protein
MEGRDRWYLGRGGCVAMRLGDFTQSDARIPAPCSTESPGEIQHTVDSHSCRGSRRGFSSNSMSECNPDFNCNEIHLFQPGSERTGLKSFSSISEGLSGGESQHTLNEIFG